MNLSTKAVCGNGKEPSGLINLADKVSTVSHTLEGTSNQPSTAVPAQINSSRRGLIPTAEAEPSVQQTLCTWLSLTVVTLAHSLKVAGGGGLMGYCH